MELTFKEGRIKIQSVPDNYVLLFIGLAGGIQITRQELRELAELATTASNVLPVPSRKPDTPIFNGILERKNVHEQNPSPRPAPAGINEESL